MNGPQRTDNWVLRRGSVKPQRNASLPAHDRSGSTGDALEVDSDALDEPSAVEEPPDGSAITGASSACTPSPPALHSFCDAAEDDTVLTGSPVSSPCSSGMSSVREPLDAQEAGQTCLQPGPALASADLLAASPVQAATVQALAELGAAEGSEEAAGKAQTEASVRWAPALPRASTPQPAALAHAAPPPSAPCREAIRQQQWSFAAIPQGTASIPSKGPASKPGTVGGSCLAAPAASTAGAGASMQAPRPAFYTRAASPPSRPPGTMNQQARRAAESGTEGAAGVAGESRRERLARLAQPKHARAQRHLQRQCQQALTAQTAAAPGTAAPSDEEALPLADSKAAQQGTATTQQLAHLAGGGIAAWRPDARRAPGIGQPPQLLALQQARPSSSSSSPMGGRAEATLGAARWPQQLGQELGAAELQTATGAYSEERFQTHMSQLSARLAARQAQRTLEADAAAAGGPLTAAHCVLCWPSGHVVHKALCVVWAERPLAALPYVQVWMCWWSGCSGLAQALLQLLEQLQAQQPCLALPSGLRAQQKAPWLQPAKRTARAQAGRAQHFLSRCRQHLLERPPVCPASSPWASAGSRAS